MFNDKYFGTPLWVWIIILTVIFVMMNRNNSCSKGEESETFSNVNKKKIYNFNTSWCGYSVRFQPEWNKFSQIVNSSYPDFEAVDIKCDESSNEQMCKEFQIPGYPSVVAVVDGKTINYDGPRESNKLIEFIKNL
jgi:thiol-disulfide isomerase/thioredoxin